jgi:hypothetical protein
MTLFDQTRIESKIKASLGVQHIRVQIQQAEAELERAHAALANLPARVRLDMLARQEEALERLYQREAKLVDQARKSAEWELRAEHVESLRIEAEPLLSRVSKCLSIVREELVRVARIEAEARANGGQVMAESLDKSAIDFFVPTLTYQPERGTWLLKR